MDFHLTFDLQAARLLRDSVTLYLERWPGGHPDEQQRLVEMRKVLVGMVLEDTIKQS